MTEGFMSPEDAERAIWSYFHQLDNHQDRRGAPLIMEPPDQLTPEEARRLREAQIPLWRKVQLKAWRLAQKKAHGSSLASAVAGAVTGWGKWIGSKLTTPAQRDYLRELMKEASEEVHEEEARQHPNALDPRTGLPLNKHDLQVGRGVVSGRDLCLDAIIPPEDLALSATTWLPPCPPDESPETWGQELTHWQSLAYKPKDINCQECRGTGLVEKKVARATSTLRRIIVRESPKIRQVRCESCGGRGSKPYWEEEEYAAIKHNTRLIGEAVERLAHDGYFDVKPIDPHDKEMGDLVWKTKGGLTLGFRLTPDGYDHMKEYVEEDDELQHVLHVLALAGKDVRDAAPEWAKDSFANPNPIKATTGGISATSGGFSATSPGGSTK